MNKIKYLSDHYRPNDKYKIIDPQRITSKVEFFNDATGERIWEPLHNKTVIAGSALTAMKLFNLDRNVLESTPTYDKELADNDALPYGTNVKIIEGADGTTYPTLSIKDADGNIIEGEYVYGLRYSELTGLLVKMCQILQGEVNELKREVAALKNN